MTHLFRSGNPSTLIWLMLYALGVKIIFLIHPLPVMPDPHAGFLYNYLVSALHHDLQWGNGHFQWIAILLLFILALELNQLLIRYHLLPGRNYYPAMSFLLLSTFHPAWNQMSASLVACCFLLPSLGIVFHPDQPSIGRAQIYNAGLMLGIASLISVSFSIFLILLCLVMMVNRPFRIAEWLLVMMGWLTPIYFYAVGSFLLNHFSWQIWKFTINWQWHTDWLNQWVTVSLVVLGLMFVIGLGLVWHHMSGMTIQVRKSWILLLCFGILATALVLWDGFSSMAYWLPLVIVISAFSSNLWWYVPVHRLKWSINLLHVFLILLAWAVIYLPVHQPQINLFPWNRHF
ncbi:hypothetical protein [Thermoflavifilum thermophilum]|uniref:Uncharacterized protein n=1 Tax=Thermoflavifilum thermophilum TaxID=1393122 RepID=A0A1I7N4L6_9BACT|nr:hypothetical protein [Thermoflavifilum thermophilum]SFV29598.1 hypothetical protein SAMN05660895_0587 [Thermoflavifilum thermophilum]